MLKYEKDMTSEELSYVKDCLRKAIEPNDEKIDKYCDIILNEVNKKKLNISSIENALKELEKDDSAGIISCGGILVALLLYFAGGFGAFEDDLKNKICIAIGVVSIIIGNVLSFNNDKAKKKLYADLDDEKNNLEKLQSETQKILNLRRYNAEVKNFINGK